MLRTFVLLAATFALVGCGGIGADAEPYFKGSFVGYYLTSQEAMPIGVRLELQASEIEQKRYTITGTATLGTETFRAEGYELASYNLDYLAPQAAPPPQGDSFMALKDSGGTTVYTLCASTTYRDYSSTDTRPPDTNVIIIEGEAQQGDEPAFCSNSYGTSIPFATAELTRQSDY